MKLYNTLEKQHKFKGKFVGLHNVLLSQEEGLLIYAKNLKTTTENYLQKKDYNQVLLSQLAAL